MDHSVHNQLIAFIWSITDSCLCDVYVRGKYRDVISPMMLLRLLDALLEPTKDKVIKQLQTQQESIKAPLAESFYSCSHRTLTKPYQNVNNNIQILLLNFQEFFNGFSGNAQAILNRFQLMTHVVFNPTAARGGLWK